MRPAHARRALNGSAKQRPALGTPRAGMYAGKHSLGYAERGEARVGIMRDSGLVRVIEMAYAAEKASPSMSLVQATSICADIGGEMVLRAQLYHVASALVVAVHALHAERRALVDGANEAEPHVEEIAHSAQNSWQERVLAARCVGAFGRNKQI